MIIICNKCKGTGILVHDVGSHKSEYEYTDCDDCNGSGRIIEKTSITTEPYVVGSDNTRVF